MGPTGVHSGLTLTLTLTLTLIGVHMVLVLLQGDVHTDVSQTKSTRLRLLQ